MAQLVVAAVGAAIGGSVLGTGIVALGMTGTAIGWTVGSLIGSAFAPGQKTQGPRLGDLTVTGSAYGTPIPYLAGSPRVSPQIIWASEKRETPTVTEQGKGGGGSKNTSYTYSVDLLLLLADNPMQGVSRIWSNGTLVYNHAAVTSEDETPWARMTFYGGGSSQLPDPTYEAAKGVDALAYRGRTTIFLEDLQLGSNGQIENLTFELYSQATDTDPALVYSGQTLRATTGATFGSAVYGNYCYTGAYGASTIQTFDVSDPTAPVSVDTLAVPTYPQEMVVSGAYLYCTFFSTSQLRIFSLADPAHPSFVGAIALPNKCLGLAVRGNYAYVPVELGSAMRLYVVDVSTPASPTVAGISDLLSDSWAEAHIALSSAQPNFAWVTATGAGTSRLNVVDISNPAAPVLVQTQLVGQTPYCISIYGDYAFVGYINESYFSVFDISTPAATTAVASGSGMGFGVYTIHAVDGLMFCATDTGAMYMWDTSVLPSNPVLLQTVSDIGSRVYNISVTPDYVYVSRSGLTAETRTFTVYTRTGGVEITYPTVRNVVDQILLRSGLASAAFDTSDLAGIARPVRALAISQVNTARQILDMLASAYFFGAVASDKIYFVSRGGAPARTLAFDEIGWHSDGDESPDPLALVIANELELPAQVALTYNAIESDYQTDTQYSDRLLSSMVSTNALTLPMGFTAAEAKQMADAMMVDSVVGLLSSKVSVGIEHSDLEPTDVVIVTGSDGSTYRMRILRRTDHGGVSDLEVVLDDASVLTQAGVTAGGTASQTVVRTIAPTALALLDIPLLHDSYNAPGYLVAVSGAGSSNWRGAGVYDSPDGTTYALQLAIDSQAVIGQANTVLADWTGGNVWDEVSTLTVQVDGELSSATAAAVEARRATNAALVGDELVQYRTAALASPGVYNLSGFLRGRRGTEWAMPTHAIGDRFVALGAAGVRFMSLQASELGALRYVKAATTGQLLSAAVAQSITPLGVALKPFSPVFASADRSTADTVLSWHRRTRLSSRITGPLAWSNPLGEASESWRLDVYTTSGYTAVVRTLYATDSQVTYTAADQTTDFGSPPPTLYVGIRQISAAVGPGYELRAAV